MAAILLAAGWFGSGLRGAELPPARFGVVSLDSPRVIYGRFQPLVDHLTAQTGRAWELSLSPTYQDVVDDLCAGGIDAAFLGPFSYVRAHAECQAAPLVRLVSGGRASYRSYILVRSGSRFSSLEDLRGARIGFGDTLSTSSHLVPRVLLREAGIDAEREMRCRYYGHHDLAARAVLLGEVDACGVRDVVAERFLARGLRALARSEPIASYPIVVAPASSAAFRAEVAQALAAYAGRARGGGRLGDSELLGGFAAAIDEDYDMVRGQAERLFGAMALERPTAELRCGETP